MNHTCSTKFIASACIVDKIMLPTPSDGKEWTITDVMDGGFRGLSFNFIKQAFLSYI